MILLVLSSPPHAHSPYNTCKIEVLRYQPTTMKEYPFALCFFLIALKHKGPASVLHTNFQKRYPIAGLMRFDVHFRYHLPPPAICVSASKKVSMRLFSSVEVERDSDYFICMTKIETANTTNDSRVNVDWLLFRHCTVQ